jgi:hypothetical protein
VLLAQHPLEKNSEEFFRNNFLHGRDIGRRLMRRPFVDGENTNGLDVQKVEAGSFYGFIFADFYGAGK